MIKYSCPNCGERCEAEEPQAGREIKCARCGVAFAIVQPPDAARAAEQPITKRNIAGWVGLILAIGAIAFLLVCIRAIVYKHDRFYVSYSLMVDIAKYALVFGIFCIVAGAAFRLAGIPRRALRRYEVGPAGAFFSIGGVCMFAAVCMPYVVEGMSHDWYNRATLIEWTLRLSAFCVVAALACGVAGLLLRNRRRVVAVAATALASLDAAVVLLIFAGVIARRW